MWNESFQFDVHVPELVMVRFVVEDYDSTSQNDLVGHYCLPLTSIQNGREAPFSESYTLTRGPSASHMTSVSCPFLLCPRVSPRSAAHQERRRHLLGRPLCSPHAPRRSGITLGAGGELEPRRKLQHQQEAWGFCQSCRRIVRLRFFLFFVFFPSAAPAAAESRVRVSVCLCVCHPFLPTFNFNCS